MSAGLLLVNVGGLALIGWIVWYFWLYRRPSVQIHVKEGTQNVDVIVKGGYTPAIIEVQAGQPLTLTFTRREASTCGEEVVLPAFGKRIHLPENEPVTVDLPSPVAGEYEFACGMNMYRGKLIVR